MKHPQSIVESVWIGAFININVLHVNKLIIFWTNYWQFKFYIKICTSNDSPSVAPAILDNN